MFLAQDTVRRRLRDRLHGGRHLSALTLVAIVVVLSACGTAPPPEPGVSRGVPPDLRGRRVILLPVQQIYGVAGNPDAELAFSLTGVGHEVDWIMEEEVQEIIRRSPTVQTRTRGLPVSIFQQAEVERVGDPLYGQLRRMAALVDAEVILLPIAATWEANEAIPDSEPRVRFTVTILEPRTGRVVWFGIEEGDEFERDDPRALASAVDNLSRTIFWYMGG